MVPITTIQIVTLLVAVIGRGVSTELETEVASRNNVCYKDIIKSGCLESIFRGFCRDTDYASVANGCCGYYAIINSDCINQMVKDAKAQRYCGNAKDNDLIDERADFLHKICVNL